MEYIDKNKSRAWAHQLIKDFLRRRIEEDGKYPDDLYAAFRADPECKDAFVAKLLEDNEGRCCYCMASIRGTTLEHVILNSTSDNDKYKEYFSIESDLDKENMKLAKDFLENPSEVPPFPHTIAYENLIPSCFGYLPNGASKCCNNFRGEKFVHPLVFRPNIHSEVKYYPNGNIIWTADPEDIIPTITKLGLDCLELKCIRRIWYHLASRGLSADEQYRDATINTLVSDFGEPSGKKEKEMLAMLVNFKKRDYWKLLAKYTYFNDPTKFTD